MFFVTQLSKILTNSFYLFHLFHKSHQLILLSFDLHVQFQIRRLQTLSRSCRQDRKRWTFQSRSMPWDYTVSHIKIRQLFDMYDDNKDGVLETITAGKMLMDLYRSMNKEFHPTATDIASYQRIFDRDNKGKITF